MQDITGFLGTGMIQDFFQIAGIDRFLKHNYYREHCKCTLADLNIVSIHGVKVCLAQQLLMGFG